MTFQYTKAKRENVDVMVSLAGPSGSGKTYSGMLLAQALAGDRPFVMGDTEGKRGLHYADDFDFERRPIAPPYHPEKYAGFIRQAVADGFTCALIDSMSHEWAGEGGMLEMADKDTAKPPSNWIKPKAAHKRMMNAFISAGIHLIFCLRADEKIEVVDNPDPPPRVLIRPIGFMPICEKGFLYEMTISLTLHPAAPGVVDLTLPHKLQDRFKPILMPGTHISSEAGEALAAWARGGTIDQPDLELWKRARKKANEGSVALRDFANNEISPDERARLKPIGTELNATAKKADEILAASLQRPSSEPEPEDRGGEPEREPTPEVEDSDIAAEADARSEGGDGDDEAPGRLI